MNDLKFVLDKVEVGPTFNPRSSDIDDLSSHPDVTASSQMHGGSSGFRSVFRLLSCMSLTHRVYVTEISEANKQGRGAV